MPGVYNVSNRIGNAAVSEGSTQSRLLGFFGDFTVGYKNFAFIHATGRNDKTSLLSAANRSFFYPSVDASVILSEAIPALKTNSILSYVKVRGGIAKVGQVNVLPYQLQNVFNPGVGFPFGGQGGFEIGNQQNYPDLKPEFTTNREVGLELGLFDRFNLEAVYYKSTTINQTVPIDISQASGYARALFNTGAMDNKGVEIDLRTIKPLVNTGGFTWDINTNFTYLESKVTSLFQQGDQVLNRINIAYPNGVASDVFAAVGKSYPALYVSDIQRVQTGQYAGQPIVSATSGYPSLDPNPKYAGTDATEVPVWPDQHLQVQRDNAVGRDRIPGWCRYL